MKRTVEALVSFGTRHTLSSQTDPKRGIGAALEWTRGEFQRTSAACGNCLTIVMNNMSCPVFNALRPEDKRDPYGVEQAMARLRTAYDWLEANLGDGPWAAGEAFTLADCAAAPSLFYADWVEEIGPDRPKLSAYRARLLAHPAVARAVDEGRPYRAFFPLGAPDRD
jgi:glutathione S-transferase